MVRLIRIIPLAWMAVVLSAADSAALIQKVSIWDYGQDPEAVRQLESEALRVAGQTVGAADLEKRLIAALPAAKTLAATDAFCRDLGIVGTATAVPALAPLLGKAETAEMARFALERISGPEALAALRKALPTAPASARPGIVGSLGRRRDQAAVPSISVLLTSSDKALNDAAATALGHIGTPAAREALTAAPKPYSTAVADALLERAPASPGIYRQLASHPSEAVQIAALRGIAKMEQSKAIPTLLTAIRSGSPRLQAVAIGELARLDSSALIREAGKLSPPARVQILAALSSAAHADALPFFENQLTAEVPEVRIAAIHGLARLGTPKQIPALAARAAQTNGDEQAAARLALASIRGSGADVAILDAIPTTADVKTKAELIRAAGERGIRSAPAALLATAASKEKPVRTESIRALRETAAPEHVPALLALLGKTEDDTERTEYERTIAAAIRRSKDVPVGALLDAWKSAGDTEMKVSLLSILSAVGNKDSLPVVREALGTKDADVSRAAINALSNWPTTDPQEDLLALARSTTDASRQALALRGYVKLVQIPSSRSPVETAKLLAAGMAAARRPDEKKIILAAAQRVVCPESLELVRASIADPAVTAEARQAATALERSLSFRRN